MNWYYLLYQTIRILLGILLFVVPLGYCLLKGNFKKGFWFTWIVWSIVILIFGILLPALATLREKATGEQSDIMCGGFVFGIIAGWLPGLIFASVGVLVHKIFMNVFIRKDN